VPHEPRQRIVIDYSAPNVAKEMHVGHLRTTVVGDALARVLEHLGHDVIRQNHVGDWGTPFGMLIERLIDVGRDSADARLITSDPNAFYQAARAEFDRNADFASRARARVVKLQGGDAETRRVWGELVSLSRVYFNRIYGELGVTLSDTDLAGESTYNDDLPAVCDELQAAGIATVSNGALCVFLSGFLGRDDRPLPLIIRKSDGGYGYATTDLAAIRRRAGALRADRIVYVIGVTQTLHLTMVWEAARKAGWLHEDVQVAHVQIGSVLGEDRKILKTKYGSSPPLTSLLDEAAERADHVLATARPDLDAAVRATISRKVGIGAVKWADLSVAHESDYVFDLDRMTSLTGNTGPYLQYAITRLRSIFAQCSDTPGRVATAADPAERTLALALLDFGSVVVDVGAGYTPHRLCAYLFDLAQKFSAFYEHCPVLKADPDLRSSRLGLCQAVQRVLEAGLNLLGMEIPAQM
jgi:arginyl-tRNA synthetase